MTQLKQQPRELHELHEKVAEIAVADAGIVIKDDEHLLDLIERVRVGLDQVLDDELSRHQQLHDQLDAIEALLDDHEPMQTEGKEQPQ